jgi:hypothetical protein
MEFVTVDDREYEEIVEKYEEILVPEEFPESPVTDTTISSAPTQGKPRCITHIFE